MSLQAVDGSEQPAETAAVRSPAPAAPSERLLDQHLDPEEWTEIINGAFEYMIKPVYKYEGTVARLTGDGILAFFGAPIAHEDDPQRAVLTGL